MKHTMNLIIAVLLITVSPASVAGDDPSISTKTKVSVRREMNRHIESLAVKGNFPIFDSESRKVVEIRLKKLHRGVVKKGPYYVSCADFVDKDGTVYDVDFLVRRDKEGYQTVSALVHSKDGKKSKYDIAHM